MKMYEYQAKEVFAKYGIPIPKGRTASSVDEVKNALQELQSVALKAQVLHGGRGKAGLIKFATSPEEAGKVAGELFGHSKKILVEERMRILKELYLSITVDRENRVPIVLASAEGGVDIESSRKVLKCHINPVIGLQDYECRNIVRKLSLTPEQGSQIIKILRALYRIFVAYDAELVEINPLCVTDKGVVALDAKLNIDDNALYRHQEYKSYDEYTDLEKKAKEADLTYVELDGNIGIVGNGAGLVMATLDAVAYFGGKPANFCDMGGGGGSELTAKAMEFVLSNPKVKVLFVNVMAGITRCDEVAKGMIAVLEKIKKVPMVVRMIGTNEAEGRRILKEAGIDALDSMEDAAKKAVEMVGGAK